jgi:hypothetical protein
MIGNTKSAAVLNYLDNQVREYILQILNTQFTNSLTAGSKWEKTMRNQKFNLNPIHSNKAIAKQCIIDVNTILSKNASSPVNAINSDFLLKTG